ncbi:MAG: N-acetylmuramoyl-L-alanine amidase family protein [Pseudobdellovibrionaceae bacterium]
MLINKLKQSIFSILLAGSLPASALHIMLDPGHGGIDAGAVYGPAKESDLVLKVAEKLKELLEKNPQFKVSLTRNFNKGISLSNRVALAEQAKADIFVSLHANAAADQRAKGVELFFQNYLPADDEGLYLARQENQISALNKDAQDISVDDLSKKSDITAILDDLNRQNRIQSSLRLSQILSHVWTLDANSSQAVIKQAPFYVITKTSMPSVLIEIGFLTNPSEAKKLLTAEYQKNLAQKIYSALLAYKEKMDNHTAKTLN